MPVPRVIGAAALLALILIVLARVVLSRRRGIAAVKFGSIDKSDFVLPPFALFYVYTVCAGAFGWPGVIPRDAGNSPALAWLGALFCLLSVAFMMASIVSFGASFRVGIDADRPGGLVTTGVFSITRNPIYVAFGLALAGELLIAPHWILLAYAVAGAAVFHRQVLREEHSLEALYGSAYRAYCSRVRRYL